MLTYEDEPTIRFAITRRLDNEPGVELLDIKIQNQLKASPPHIRVKIEARLSHALEANSAFELPAEFSHQHLLNEIDEVAEQYKKLRVNFWKDGRVLGPEQQINGTGLRGRWSNYG